MKNLTLALAVCCLLAALAAHAQTNWYWNTNMFSGLTYLTNAYSRETTNDNYTDTYVILVNKINANNRVLTAWHESELSGITNASTNAIFADPVQTPTIKLDMNTFSHSTNVTTLPINTIAADADYLYRVSGNYTNASGTNFFRIPWDKTPW